MAKWLDTVWAYLSSTKPCVPLSIDVTVYGDVTTCRGMDLPLCCRADLGGALQTAAAGDIHARDGHALAIVLSKDLGRFFGAVRIIELWAADERDAAAQQFLVESGVSISCAIVIVPVGQAGKRSPRPSQ